MNSALSGTLRLTGNPFKLFILPQPLADTSLSETVSMLTQQGVQVYAYPSALNLSSPNRTPNDGVVFTLTGPPDSYCSFGSSELSTWSNLQTITNLVGSGVFTDVQTNVSVRFYRASPKAP